MDTNAIININSFQKVGDDSDTIDLSARAKYHKKDGVHHLWYDEIDMESDEATQTYLKVEEDRVLLRKKGPSVYDMVFDIAKKTTTTINSPYGILQLDIITESIEQNEDDESLELILDYALYSMGEKISNHNMKIEIKKEDS